MTTYTTFSPSGIVSPPFQFQATLESIQPNGIPVSLVYNVLTTWSLFGSRWYLNINALDGTLIGARALVGSPAGMQLSALAWANGEVTATTMAPHGYRVASSVALTIAGATPDGYNGSFECFVTGPSTFTYPLAADPGLATSFGQALYNINLVGGLSDELGNPITSTLVFRAPSQQFEVSP